MRKKIGELLVERGLVSRSQLAAALQMQLICGGHLGTCLLEQTLLDEDALGTALAEVTKVPYAPFSVLQDIPPRTIKALPRRLAESCEAVPLKLLAGTLHLAMIDVRNLRAVDEIAFVSGYKIVPWVSPEVRIFQALEKYYGMPRRPRYVTLCRRLEILAARRSLEAMEGEDLSGARGAGAGTAGRSGQSEHAEKGFVIGDQGIGDLGGEYGYGPSWKEIAEDLNIQKTGRSPGGSRGTESSIRPSGESSRGPTLWQVTDQLCRAEGKQQAVDALLDYTSSRMRRSLFFGVSENIASVWESRGLDLDESTRSRARFTVTAEKIFELLLGNEYYRGPLSSGTAYASFYKTLGMEVPAEVLLFPVYLDDHLVAVFHGDGGPSGAIEGETDDFLRLFRLFTHSVSLIILKDRMRVVGSFSQDALRTDPHPRLPNR